MPTIYQCDVNKDGIVDINDLAALAHTDPEMCVACGAYFGQFPSEYVWVWQSKADPYTVSYLNNPLPGQIPTDEEIKVAFTAYLDSMLGQFVREHLDAGITLTIKSYTVDVENRLLDSRQVRDFTVDTYQVYVTFALYFNSDTPLLSLEPQSPFLGLVLNPATIKAIGAAIAFIILGIGGYFFLRGLSTISSEVSTSMHLTNPSDRDVEVTLPDGSKVTVPAGGTLDYTFTKSTEEPATQAWIGIVIIAICCIGALVVLPPVLEHLGAVQK